MPHPLYKHNPCIILACHFAYKRNTPPINSVTGPQPKVETEAVHGSHRGLLHDFAGIVPGDLPQRLCVISAHVLYDSWPVG